MTKSLLACPSNLSGEARCEWKRVSRQLHEAGLLSEADHDTLAKYCQAWADLKEAEVLAQRARHAVCEFLVKFGLTPRKR